MNNLTVETSEIAGGYKLRRSDGREFFLLWKDNGHAILYEGRDPSTPPVIGLFDFDISIGDKLSAARERVLGL